ncbi:Pentatricopeptide repeat-containing protein [Hibiscus syriacus]|uniref:Pentatricopeptide repeat-containing protein n=1 Tax=Hibiscus syriacus TaxID=106335 RepID=A0A6A2WFC4_HIBSY|nr:Pentatricopeptide repeat-containing protein [Hibiscus syriacus]
MVTKLLAFFHRRVSRPLTRREPYFQWRSLSYTIDRPSEYPSSSSHSFASVLSISSNPSFALLGFCKNIDCLKKVRALFVVSGIKSDLLCHTKLVGLYGTFGHVGCARLVFDRIPEPDFYSWKVMIRWACSELQDIDGVKYNVKSSRNVVSWTSMLAGYVQNNCAKEALVLFNRMREAMVESNHFTLVSLVTAYMYVKCGGLRDARSVFNKLSSVDLVSMTAMIVGYSQSRFPDEALKLFADKKSFGIFPNAVTVASLLSACAQLSNLSIGRLVHSLGIRLGVIVPTVVKALVDMYAKCGAIRDASVYVGTALLNFYAKCGDSKSARVVFDSMGEKNTVTWSAMIGGYGIQGDSSGFLALFSDMIKENLEPNEVIFTRILSACTHTGRLGEGWKYFNSMCQDYNFVPSMKHYACMVDMLARAGRLEEAFDFIEKLPFKPDLTLFGAFLHGCGLHSRFDLGEVAIKKMLDLHPDKACYYVLISNLYASDGRWAQVNRVRELMKQSGLSKNPCCSITEMETNKNLSFSRVACLA